MITDCDPKLSDNSKKDWGILHKSKAKNMYVGVTCSPCDRISRNVKPPTMRKEVDIVGMAL